MCGICGILDPEVTAREIEAMVAVQHHRGPDDRGVAVLEDGAVGLGHNRLSIIDLSEAGHQPMASASGRYVIAFNGESRWLSLHWLAPWFWFSFLTTAPLLIVLLYM